MGRNKYVKTILQYSPKFNSFVVFTIRLLDSCGLSMSKKYGGDFGKQKTWGTSSLVILPVICGLLIDTISEYRGILFINLFFV